MNQTGNSAIADTVAAVFRGREFTEHNGVSIGQLVSQWIWSAFIRFLGFAASHPAVGLVLRVTLGLIALVILARIGFGLLARYAPSAIGRQHLEVGRGRDWWHTAQDLASKQEYTGAAHALYLALLALAAHRGLVSLHESKTTGDYLREVRSNPDAFDIPRFTDFTRSYETVIYGIGTCDEERYSSLNAMATTLINTFSARSGSQSRIHGARP